MTSATSEKEQRRKRLLTQLAEILQMEPVQQEECAQGSGSPSEVSAAELRALGLPVFDSEAPTGMEPAMRRNAARAASSADARANEFVPLAPADFSSLRLAEAEVESLMLKFLMHRHNAIGCDIAAQIGLPFGICEKLLHELKTDRLVVLKGAAGLNDYLYELTEAGTERALKFADSCRYFGAAPICLDDYAASVAAQSLQNGMPQIDDLRRAFADLMLSPESFERLGRAITSGKGLFLHGPPGNGKTSIAQRVTRAYGETIWIPRAISAWGEIIRVYDPSCHVELPLAKGEGLIDEEKIDHRWVRIRRPTIIVGGELVLDNLEITPNTATGVAEAPLQLKSNCGTLVIDDFGRQQVAPAALLNRWIVPLEKRYDYLNLTSGRKIRVPFDQFVIFSTNLQPRDLVDEAFLRRIPYKIDVSGPTEEQFRDLFLRLAASMGMEPCRPPLEYLIENYYRKPGRMMRFCHPRDLLRQVKTYYDFLEQPAKLSVEALKAAATDYFSVL
jgi:predicted ATPase with chaperone activity